MSNQPIEPGPHQVSLEAVSVGQPLVLGLEGLQAPAALSGSIARKDGDREVVAIPPVRLAYAAGGYDRCSPG